MGILLQQVMHFQKFNQPWKKNFTLLLILFRNVTYLEFYMKSSALM